MREANRTFLTPHPITHIATSLLVRKHRAPRAGGQLVGHHSHHRPTDIVTERNRRPFPPGASRWIFGLSSDPGALALLLLCDRHRHYYGSGRGPANISGALGAKDGPHAATLLWAAVVRGLAVSMYWRRVHDIGNPRDRPSGPPLVSTSRSSC